MSGLVLARLTSSAFPRLLREAVVWFGLSFLLMLGYTYRDQLLNNPILAEFIPSEEQIDKTGDLRLRAQFGHFFINAKVNGKPMRFMVDTGASDVVLSPRDAAKLGHKKPDLRFNRFYHTANGLGRGAGVTLKRVQMGPLSLSNVRASVNAADMNYSLLGMSVLRKFRSFEMSGNTLILRL